MNRFDRILAILLLLRSGKSISAADLARRFEVSRRTIYRDIDTLSSLGVPVYAERGREGGFQLLEGYFLPPLMLSTGEAVVLLLGLTLLHSLRAKPFQTDLETAENKLLAAMPARLQAILSEAQKIIGFENLVADAFHPEPADPQLLEVPSLEESDESPESNTISLFLRAILDGKTVSLRYHSPYRGKTEEPMAEPLGIFWDRDRWYLVGKRVDQDQPLRLWRADRVLSIKSNGTAISTRSVFDVRKLLGHNWLKSAMAQWGREAPVRIRLTQSQARRLQQDWYYRYAEFEPIGNDQIIMTFGEDNCRVVLDLLRWLGPGAELIEPKKWRRLVRDELDQMLAIYAAADDELPKVRNGGYEQC